MEHPDRLFQRSLAVSLGVHVLIFGTALAFARYGESLLPPGAPALTVALMSESVGDVSGKGPAVRRVAHKRLQTQPSVPAMPDEKTTDVKEEQDASPPSASTRNEWSEREGTGFVTPSEGFGNAASSAGEVTAGENTVGEGTGLTSDAILSEQRRMIRFALEKVKTYPRFARERGIEGTVLIKFKVLPSGNVETVDVVKSSGAQILDEASVKTVYRAVPLPYVNGWVEVPMVYELK